MINRLARFLLYLFDPAFRRLVLAKRQGADSQIATSETVIHVLRKAK